MLYTKVTVIHAASKLMYSESEPDCECQTSYKLD